MMTSKSLRAILFPFLLLLTLSMSACSPAPPSPYLFFGIEQIGVGENVLYARTTQYCRYGAECEDGEVIHTYYASHDQGKTWQEVDLPPVKMEKFKVDADHHVAMCLTHDSEHCYRITGQENVEVSNDGGVRWHADWQIPDGRRLYMERYVSGRSLSITPYDLQIIETGDDHLVVVAMGYEGVLVRSVDGVWSRYAVDTLAPTPYQAETLGDALNALIYIELPLSILIVFVWLLVLTFSAWITFFVKSEWAVRRKMFLSWLPVLLAIAMLATYYSLSFLSRNIDGLHVIRSFLLSNFFFMIRLAGFYVLVSPLLTYVIVWVRMISFPSNTKFALASFLFSIVLPMLLGIFILVPYLLWALGMISIHQTAQTWAISMGIVFLLISFIIEIRTAALSAVSKREVLT